MLRTRPSPLGPLCLSIDPGSQHCGVCVLDGATQRIRYLNIHPLLGIHEAVVRNTADVKEHLDGITTLV